MELKPNLGDVTQMDWTADVNVSGTIASVGARLMEGTAKKMTAQFFDCVRQKVEAPEEAEASEAAVGETARGAREPDLSPSPSPAQERGARAAHNLR